MLSVTVLKLGQINSPSLFFCLFVPSIIVELYSATGIRASTADIERLAERVTGGMAARQALRLVEFGQLRARVLAPVTTITVEAAARIRP